MLSILVCFSIIKDYSSAAAEQWLPERVSDCLEDNMPLMPDTYDQTALEVALRLRDDCQKSGEEVVLSALTVGKKEVPRRFSETLFALGYKNVVIMDAPDKAGAIARYAEKNPQHIIMFGIKSSIYSSGSTGIKAAQRLDLPYFGNVGEARRAEGGVIVTASRPDGVVSARLRTPVVLGINNSVCGYLRIPTLKARLEARKKEPEALLMTAGKADILPDKVRVRRQKNSCRMIEGTAKEQAEYLRALIRGEQL